MSKLVVDYDVIIKIQTLSWENYDVQVDLDRANHIDCDVHISLLYGIDEDSIPEEYSSIRVGYPANLDTRIGYLTPPASPRKFIEEKLRDQTPNEAAHQYIGDVSISPLSTRLGIKQSLLFKNVTGVMEMIISDSPIVGGESRVFDASAWVDKVDFMEIEQYVFPIYEGQLLDEKFVLNDHIISVENDVTFNIATKNVSGTLQLNYNHETLHISKVRVEFNGGWSPQDYRVEGVGSWVEAVSPIILYFSYTDLDSFHPEDLLLNAGMKLYLRVQDRTTPNGSTRYKWVTIEKGLDSSNWRAESVHQDYQHVSYADNIYSATPMVLYNPVSPQNLYHDVTVTIKQGYRLSHVAPWQSTVHTNHFGEEVNETLVETMPTADKIQFVYENSTILGVPVLSAHGEPEDIYTFGLVTETYKPIIDTYFITTSPNSTVLSFW